MRKISNTDDIIDSRDVIVAIDELEEGIQDQVDAIEDWAEERAELEALEKRTLKQADREAVLTQSIWLANEEIEDLKEELKPLKELADEAGGYAADWRHGEVLIRDSYFEDYAHELANDIGAVNSDAGWPNSCIDWEQAARELQMDYTTVDFDGVDYWIR